MLPPEKDDGNIEYKRYIMIKIKNLDSNNSIDSEIKEIIPLLKEKSKKSNVNDLNLDDVYDFQNELEKKRLRSSLRFNQLASQMKFRLNEGNGVAIYYLGVNDDGTIYELNQNERSTSLDNLREIVRYIKSKIDKIIFNDNYIKIIIKDKNFKKLKEKNILLLGDTESGKTTFLAYLIKNKIDTDNSKARLHILNHKHEIESGKTSSFTCQYIDFNETNFVFIDSPGWDGVNNSDGSFLNMKSSKKRNKLILTFNFDLILFFDKPNDNWYKKDFYQKIATYLNIPTYSINLFDKNSYINLVSPLDQDLILSKFYSILKNEISNDTKSTHSLEIESKVEYLASVNNVSSMLEKMEFIYPEENKYSDSLFSINDYKKKLKRLFNNKYITDDKKYDLLNLNFISSYPHQDLGLILSGYLSEGKLKINQKLYCYLDLKVDNDNDSELFKLNNPIEVQVKSIYKNGNSVDSIDAPSTITISIDYYKEYGKKILEIYGDLSKLLRFKDIQVNFLSNFSYKPVTKFNIIWLFYVHNYKVSAKDPHIPVGSSIQIMVKNQLINIKKIKNSNDEDYYVNSNLKKNRELFNIDDQLFIYENLNSWGFGKILSI